MYSVCGPPRLHIFAGQTKILGQHPTHCLYRPTFVAFCGMDLNGADMTIFHPIFL